MTFRELLVMVRLYRAAPADLRRWADQQLPDLKEAAELTEDARATPVGRCTCSPGNTITIGCPIHDRADNSGIRWDTWSDR